PMNSTLIKGSFPDLGPNDPYSTPKAPAMNAPTPGRASQTIDRGPPPSRPAAPAAEDGMLAKLKIERDRYVAFAFAAGDVLIEIGTDRQIRMVSGACQGLCGRLPAEILNTDIRDLAASTDRTFLHRLLDCLTIMGRLDPVPVRLAHKN